MFQKTEEVVSKEIAVQEILDFVKSHGHKKVSLDFIEEKYPEMLEKLMSGDLKGLEDKPVYKLEEPIKNDEGEVILSEITFVRTRIKPTQLASLSKGTDISKDPMGFALKCFAFLTGEPIAYFDLMSKNDFNLIQEIGPVFM